MAAPSEPVTLASRLIGVWKLHGFADEQPGRPETQPFGPRPKGFLIYTADGFVSAQLMRPERAAFHSPDWLRATPEEYQESASGYIAYCGVYTVDEVKRTVTHLPSVALLPNLLARPQCRSIDLDGNRLVLRTAQRAIEGGNEVVSRLEWLRHIPAEIRAHE